MPARHMELKVNWKGNRMQWHSVFLHKRPDRIEGDQTLQKQTVKSLQDLKDAA